MAGVRVLTLAGAMLTVAAVPNAAQQMQRPQQVYWYLSYYRVDWSKVDSLRKLLHAYSLPVVDEAKKMGTLLDYHYLIHSHGSEANVVLVRKFRTFAAIEADTSFGAAYRKLYPDSTKRRQINQAFNEIFGSGLHRDEIYTEVMKP